MGKISPHIIHVCIVSSLASHAVLATLHVPIPQSKTDVQQYLDDDAKQDKQRRLASLLGLQIPPKRKSLLVDLVPILGAGKLLSVIL